MVAAKKQPVPAVVASVFADGNDVRCLNHFRWGVAKSATLTAITPNDCCSKRCLTALLDADLLLGRLPRLEARPFFVRRQLVVPSPTKREGENQVAADRVVLQELDSIHPALWTFPLDQLTFGVGVSDEEDR